MFFSRITPPLGCRPEFILRPSSKGRHDGLSLRLNTHTDPAFINEYRRLTGGDGLTPLMPDEQAKMVKEIPRDAETIELFKRFAATGRLPAR